MKKLTDYLNQQNVSYQAVLDWAEDHNAQQIAKNRLQFLAGIKENQSTIKFTFENDAQIGQLFEHEEYKKFAKSSIDTLIILKM